MIRMVTSPESLTFRGERPATGDIWLLVGDQEFPMSGWNDFVLVILEAFVAGLSRLLAGEQVRITVHFMDGPYAVELERSSSSTVRLRALERKGGSTEKMAGHTEVLSFADDLAAQTRALLAKCRKQESWSKDAMALESALSALEAQRRRMVDPN